MEIIECSEGFELKDGRMQFHHVKGIVRVAEALYLAKWHDRHEKSSDFSQLYAFSSGQIELELQILRELEACEVLDKHPHPNIASYYGYHETRGRVSGLCFKQYCQTLAKRVNPGHLNKSYFLMLAQPLVNLDDSKTWLAGILDGIRHLHSLGLVHNDINPANIMFDQDGLAVLIDFDSCRRVGKSLRGTQTKRTYVWHDPDVDVAVEKNDMDAFAELQTWLCGHSADDYLFGY